jgi:signal transduction histidine kinase
MAATLAVFAAVVYGVVAERAERAARLVARTQLIELLGALEARAQTGTTAEYEAWCAEYVASRASEADPELALGIRLLRFDGRLRVDAGALRGVDVVLPSEVAKGHIASEVYAGRLRSAGRYFVASAAAPLGFVQVAVSTRHWADGLAELRNVLLAALPLMLLASGIAGLLLARRSLEAVGEIARAAEHLSSANLHETIPAHDTGDEFDRLVLALNAMLARIRTGVEHMHRFNANAAHELRTPLQRVGSRLDATLAQPQSAEAYRAALLELREEIAALGGALNALLRLAQVESGLDPAHAAPVELAKLLRTQLEFFAPLAEARQIALVLVEPLPDAVVRGDASWLERLFSNLLDNAVKYARAGDRVELSARTESGCIAVTVADSGPGIAAEDLARLWDRFARGAAQTGRGGFGLGLALAREIARAHDGDIAVESAPGAGARFTVTLPLFTAPRVRHARPSERRTSQGKLGGGS